MGIWCVGVALLLAVPILLASGEEQNGLTEELRFLLPLAALVAVVGLLTLWQARPGGQGGEWFALTKKGLEFGEGADINQTFRWEDIEQVEETKSYATADGKREGRYSGKTWMVRLNGKDGMGDGAWKTEDWFCHREARQAFVNALRENGTRFVVEGKRKSYWDVVCR